MFLKFFILLLNYLSLYQETNIFIFFHFIQIFLLLHYTLNYSYIKFPNNFFPSFEITNQKNVKLILSDFNSNIVNKIENKLLLNLEIFFYKKKTISKLKCKNLTISYVKNDFPDLSGCFIDNIICDNNYYLNNVDYKYFPMHLQYLSIQNSNITSFSIKNDYLRELYLSYNRIVNVNINCKNLKILALDNNALVEIDINTPNLSFLDVNSNYLENINVDSKKLNDINLERNQFVVLPDFLINIKNIYLYGNPIIPNLNTYEWNVYFEQNNPYFFENNLDFEITNIYYDKELVHNSYVNNNIKKCIKELYDIYESDMNKYYVDLKLLKKINDIDLMNYINKKFTLKEMMSTIFYLAKEKNVLEELIEILNFELEDGKKYCVSGKIGRILTAIMGFDLINNKITISRNQEIMIKYDMIKNNLMKEIPDTTSQQFIIRMRNELQYELKMLGLKEDEINLWVREIA